MAIKAPAGSLTKTVNSGLSTFCIAKYNLYLCTAIR